MTDAVGTIGMFAEITEPKAPGKRMARIDVRLPDDVVAVIQERSETIGVSASEFTRWLIIDGLERRDLL